MRASEGEQQQERECSADTLRRVTLLIAFERPRGLSRPARAFDGSVPDANVAVQRVALHGRLAQGLDRVDEVVRRGTMRRARGRDDVLLDHHRTEVVGAELEGDLADL